MARYLLHHRHDPGQCGVAYAAFKGEPSPLRHKPALSSCLAGGHELWWVVEADSPDDARGRLPHFLATRSAVTMITEVEIP